MSTALTKEAIAWPELRRQRKAIVVVDVVESVRLMQVDEADVIDRWRRFVNEVRTQVLQPHGGRLVKSLGDGLLLEFKGVPAAVAASLDIQERIAATNTGRAATEAIRLRVGVHAADIVIDDLDVYGVGVNLAARLATLAGPGEIVVSAEVRDQLTDRLDARIVDLGECFLKHYADPVRAYSVRPTASAPEHGVEALAFTDHLPSVAVLPFWQTHPATHQQTLGNALADDVIAALSRSVNMKVISRLSTAAFRGPDVHLQRVRSMLGVAYVVSGSYRLHSGKATVRVELCDARIGRVLWSDTLTARVADVFRGQDVVVPVIAANVGRAMVEAEIERASALPISTLDGYTLYLSGLVMLHRLSRVDFGRSRELLEHLSHRHPQSPAPHALLAKWHVLNMVQGWAAEPTQAGLQAQDCARRALELRPDHAFALSMQAIAMAHLGQDLEVARDHCIAATRADPHESNAWLALAGIHSYLGEGGPAESAAVRAVELSPMDPARFLFEVFLAAAKIAAAKYGDAAEAARTSIRLNSVHPASHRLLTIALALDGHGAQACEAAQGLLRVDPQFRVGKYLQRFAGRDRPHAAAMTKALLDAGLPA